MERREWEDEDNFWRIDGLITNPSPQSSPLRKGRGDRSLTYLQLTISDYYDARVIRTVCHAVKLTLEPIRVPFSSYQVYGTRKNFPVYGSFTTDPDAKLVTSIYFPSSGV